MDPEVITPFHNPLALRPWRAACAVWWAKERNPADLSAFLESQSQVACVYERTAPAWDPRDAGTCSLLDDHCQSYSKYPMVFWGLVGFPWPSSATTGVKRHKDKHYLVIHPYNLQQLQLRHEYNLNPNIKLFLKSTSIDTKREQNEVLTSLANSCRVLRLRFPPIPFKRPTMNWPLSFTALRWDRQLNTVPTKLVSTTKSFWWGERKNSI